MQQDTLFRRATGGFEQLAHGSLRKYLNKPSQTPPTSPTSSPAALGTDARLHLLRLRVLKALRAVRYVAVSNGPAALCQIQQAHLGLNAGSHSLKDPYQCSFPPVILVHEHSLGLSE